MPFPYIFLWQTPHCLALSSNLTPSRIYLTSVSKIFTSIILYPNTLWFSLAQIIFHSLKSLTYFLFTISFLPLECNLQEAEITISSACWAHHSKAINICWMNEWILKFIILFYLTTNMVWIHHSTFSKFNIEKRLIFIDGYLYLFLGSIDHAEHFYTLY